MLLCWQAIQKTQSKWLPSTLQLPTRMKSQSTTGASPTGDMGDQMLMMLMNKFAKATMGTIGKPEVEIQLCKPSAEKQPLAHGTSNSSLGSSTPSPANTDSSHSPQPVPPAPSALPLENMAAPEPGQEPANEEKTLEDYEKQNMKRLLDRDGKKAGNGQGKAKCLKRPASSKPKPAPRKRSKSTGEPAPVKGCLRCRGNHNGCDTCLSPSFKGLRLNREQWKAHAKLNGLK